MHFYPLLKSLGITTFVTYYHQIKEKSRESLKDFFTYEVREDWSVTSVQTKTSNAKSLFNNSLELDALVYIIYDSKKIESNLIEKAKSIYEKEISDFNGNISNSQRTRDFNHEGLGIRKFRRTQSVFKAKLIEKYGNKCAVTDLNNSMLLRASHIKPWSESNDQEKTSVYNGLLLSPLYDFLFDKNLITFSEEGQIMISGLLNQSDILLLGIDNEATLKIDIDDQLKINLQLHRKKLLKS